jgi:uncharacterized membrane protein YphA (DoxX/SURF4 family)
MPPTPWNDAADFLSKSAWTTPVCWLLLAASLIVAWFAFARLPEQRSPRAVAIWLLRLLIGAMWWQQSLWKIPPNFDGLKYWMQQMVDHAAIPLQGRLVAQIVLPNITLFGPLIYLVEVAIGVSLMLGLLSRLGALLGALMALNLWLGLYSAQGEWPWTYMFLLVIQVWFVIDPPGRCLGIDAFAYGRNQRHRHYATAALVR